jgi:hypothetical protein
VEKQQATPREMAELAKGLLRKKMPELELSMDGELEEHAMVKLSSTVLWTCFSAATCFLNFSREHVQEKPSLEDDRVSVE